MIVIRQTIVTFLILLQLVAPLLHAHSGMELSTDNLHVPGLELLDKQFSNSETLEPLYHHPTEGFVVGVSNGINQFNEIINDDFKVALFSDAVLPIDYCCSPKLITYQPEVFYPKLPFLANTSRAPPQV